MTTSSRPTPLLAMILRMSLRRTVVLNCFAVQLKADLIATETRYLDDSGSETVRYGDDEFEMTKEEFKAKTDTDLPAIEHTQKVSWGDSETVGGIKDTKALEAICFKLYQ